MSGITIVIAPPGLADRVLEVLVDLSALDLLEPFAWLSQAPAGDLSATWVAAGRRQATSLPAIVGHRADLDLVRLVDLLPLVEGEGRVETQLDNRLWDEVARLGVSDVVRYAVAFAYADAAVAGPDWSRAGWHNLLLSPEDRATPAAQTHRPWSVQEGPVALARRVAPTVAGLLGLWSATEGPFDHEQPIPGIRLVRCFHTSLDATAAEARLREAVLSMAPWPRPAVEEGQVRALDDPQLAAEMSNRLWAKHPQVLRTQREEFKRPTGKEFNWWEALKDFFGFLGQAIMGAPGRWLKNKAHQLKTGAASALQSALYGAGSAYTIVVKGTRSDGLPAGWDDTLAALGDVEDSVMRHTSGLRQLALQASTDLGPLWQDYVNGALTLADAGFRDQNMPPIKPADATLVVPGPGRVAPSATDRFTTPPALEAVHQVPGVFAADLLTAQTLQARLESMKEGRQVHAAGREEDRLKAWRAQTQATYVGQVGGRLLGEIEARLAEVRGYLALIERLNQVLRFDGTEEEQRRLAKAMRIALIVTAVLIVALVVVGGVGLVPWPVPAIGGPVVLIAGLGAAFAAFVRRQRGVYQALHAQRSAGDQLLVVQRNLVRAIGDLRRLTAAHAQFLEWSRVLGEFMAAPLGRQPQAEPTGHRPVHGLAMSVQVAWLALTDRQIADMAAQLKPGLFRAGWLGPEFDRLLAGVAAYVGPAMAMAVAGDPKRQMFQQSGDILTRFADRLVALGVTADGADQKWAELLAGALARRPGGLWEDIDDRAERFDAQGRAVEAQDADEFAAALRQSSFAGQTMDPSFLTATGLNDGQHAVESEKLLWGDRSGLSFSQTLVQWTKPIPPEANKLIGGRHNQPSVFDGGLVG